MELEFADVFERAIENLKRHLGACITLALIFGIASALLAAIAGALGGSAFLSLAFSGFIGSSQGEFSLLALAFLVLAALLEAAAVFVLLLLYAAMLPLAAQPEVRQSAGDLARFARARSTQLAPLAGLYFALIGAFFVVATLFSALIPGISTLLILILVFGVIYLGIRLSLAVYAIAEYGKGVRDAVERSVELTGRDIWAVTAVWALMIVAGVLASLIVSLAFGFLNGAAPFGIGTILALPAQAAVAALVALIGATLYFELDRSGSDWNEEDEDHGAEAPAPTPAAAPFQPEATPYPAATQTAPPRFEP